MKTCTIPFFRSKIFQATMKYIYIAVVLALTVGIATGKLCSHNKNCKRSECCVAKKGYSLKKGTCTTLAKEGEDCADPDSALAGFGGKYMYYCPCAKGFECKPENNDTKGFFSKRICKPKGITTIITTEEPTEASTAGKSKITDDEWDSRGMDDSDES